MKTEMHHLNLELSAAAAIYEPWCGIVWYDMIWYSMVWYDMVVYGMI